MPASSLRHCVPLNYVLERHNCVRGSCGNVFSDSRFCGRGRIDCGQRHGEECADLGILTLADFVDMSRGFSSARARMRLGVGAWCWWASARDGQGKGVGSAVIILQTATIFTARRTPHPRRRCPRDAVFGPTGRQGTSGRSRSSFCRCSACSRVLLWLFSAANLALLSHSR